MMELTAQILVIDDDKAMRDACFQTLSRQGYQVELSSGPYLEPADLVFAGTILSQPTESSAVSLKDLERNHIIHTLQRFDGHKSEAARALGIDVKPCGKS